MAESSTKKVGCITKDRISELPQNIQEIILCFLPLRDAVRTSVLSKKWRHCWTTIPDLVFDCDFADSMCDKLEQYKDPELMAHKFVRVINKILILHNAPIVSFSLTFLPLSDVRIIHDYVDQWIPLLSRKGMKQLTLEDYDWEEFTAIHHFPSLELSHLRIANAYLPYTPAFKGFTYLRKLELIDVTDLGNSILDCPVLEMLTLVICEGLLHEDFLAPKLKYFYQLHRQIDLEYSLDGLENLAECALSLRLAEDEITNTKTSNVVKVFGSLHKIEKFSAGLCFIKSAPNLCKLHISATHDAVEENLKKYWVEDSEDCTIDHLEIVTFSYFRGLEAELDLVKLLLSHSPSLKTMLIHCSADIKKGVEITKAEEMWNYPRASSKAQIRYLEHPVHIDAFGPWVKQFDLGD